MSFSTFDPAWGRLLYEYGVIGFAAYVSFLAWRLFSGGFSYVNCALFFQFLFLGGYLSTPPVHIVIWALALWAAPERVAADLQEQPRTALLPLRFRSGGTA